MKQQLHTTFEILQEPMRMSSAAALLQNVTHMLDCMRFFHLPVRPSLVAKKLVLAVEWGTWSAFCQTIWFICPSLILRLPFNPLSSLEGGLGMRHHDIYVLCLHGATVSYYPSYTMLHCVMFTGW